MKIPTITRLLPIATIVVLLLISIPSMLLAQGVSVYPTELYRGQNVITIKHPAGIERVEIASTRYIESESSTGFLSDCPDSINIEAGVLSVTSGEKLELTIYGCDGSLVSRSLTTQNWTILHEYTGDVELTTDTCLSCRIEGGGIRWLRDIETTNPDLVVRINQIKIDDRYLIDGIRPFRYEVCYTPSRLGRGVDTILIHLERDQPNGGYEVQTIAKPISWAGVPPEGPIAGFDAEISKTDAIPPLVDPTPFRNIVMPSAESLPKGEWFYGNYMVVGHLAGYGATDRLTILAGGSFVPDFISRLYLGTLGARYQVVREGGFSAAAGLQVAFSSATDSDIRTIAPHGLLSYGNDSHRATIGVGYGFKRHVIPAETFDRDALVLAVGFNTEIGRGWKLAAEYASIESSGIAPLLVTGRHFGERWAIDFGLGFDLAADNVLFFNDAVSGEIEELSILPFLSGIWRF